MLLCRTPCHKRSVDRRAHTGHASPARRRRTFVSCASLWTRSLCMRTLSEVRVDHFSFRSGASKVSTWAEDDAVGGDELDELTSPAGVDVDPVGGDASVLRR